MNHRYVWYSLPVAALVLGLGAWGIDQRNARTAMAAELNSRYSNSFHELTAHVADLQEEVGKARVTNDATMFQERLRSIWRLSALAQDEIGKIPLQLMPLHQTQSALSFVASKADNWIVAGAKPSSPGVQAGLDKMFSETQTIQRQTADLQAKIMNQNLTWTAAETVLNSGKGDNQIVDGFRKLDTSMGAFVETASPESVPTSALKAFKQQAAVSHTQAQNVVKQFFTGHHLAVQSIKAVTDPQLTADVYAVKGTVDGTQMEASVSRNGGHLLWYSLQRPARSATADFGVVAADAIQFLHAHGFKQVTETDAYQLGNIGYFTFSPVVHGASVLDQAIEVKVGLDNPTLPLAFNDERVYLQPVSSVPARRFSAAKLRSALNPKDRVEMTQDTLVLDRNQTYQPAVSYFVTRDGATYRIDVSASTGKELDTTDLQTR